MSMLHHIQFGAAAGRAAEGSAQPGELVGKCISSGRGNYLANLTLYPGRTHSNETHARERDHQGISQSGGAHPGELVGKCIALGRGRYLANPLLYPQWCPAQCESMLLLSSGGMLNRGSWWAVE